MNKLIHFQRYFYENGKKIIYDNLYVKNTKANRELLKKIDTFIKHWLDDNFTMTHKDWTFNPNKDSDGEFLNFMVYDLDILDLNNVTEISYEW